MLAFHQFQRLDRRGNKNMYFLNFLRFGTKTFLRRNALRPCPGTRISAVTVGTVNALCPMHVLGQLSLWKYTTAANFHPRIPCRRGIECKYSRPRQCANLSSAAWMTKLPLGRLPMFRCRLRCNLACCGFIRLFGRTTLSLLCAVSTAADHGRVLRLARFLILCNPDRRCE